MPWTIFSKKSGGSNAAWPSSGFWACWAGAGSPRCSRPGRSSPRTVLSPGHHRLAMACRLSGGGPAGGRRLDLWARTPALQAALEIDHRCGLKERVSSTLAMHAADREKRRRPGPGCRRRRPLAADRRAREVPRPPSTASALAASAGLGVGGGHDLPSAHEAGAGGEHGDGPRAAAGSREVGRGLATEAGRAPQAGRRRGAERRLGTAQEAGRRDAGAAEAARPRKGESPR